MSRTNTLWLLRRRENWERTWGKSCKNFRFIYFLEIDIFRSTRNTFFLFRLVEPVNTDDEQKGKLDSTPKKTSRRTHDDEGNSADLLKPLHVTVFSLLLGNLWNYANFPGSCNPGENASVQPCGTSKWRCGKEQGKGEIEVFFLILEKLETWNFSERKGSSPSLIPSNASPKKEKKEREFEREKDKERKKEEKKGYKKFFFNFRFHFEFSEKWVPSPARLQRIKVRVNLRRKKRKGTRRGTGNTRTRPTLLREYEFSFFVLFYWFYFQFRPFIKVEKHPNGGASVLKCNWDSIRKNFDLEDRWIKFRKFFKVWILKNFEFFFQDQIRPPIHSVRSAWDWRRSCVHHRNSRKRRRLFGGTYLAVISTNHVVVNWTN